MHRASPEIKLFKSFKEETAYLTKHLRQFEAENISLNSVCLVVRTTDLLKQYQNALTAEGILCYPIRRSIPDDRTKPGLRLATMHRVKGLEFYYVIISIQDGSDKRGLDVTKQFRLICRIQSRHRRKGID